MDQFSVTEMGGLRVLEGPVGAGEIEAEERWKGHFALCDSVVAARA